MGYYALIMAGGIGTRLWPLSRRSRPKQALKLVGERTMVQHAVDRLAPLFRPEQVFVVARGDYMPLLSSQVPELPPENFIVEPEGRGTAPAIGLGAIHLLRRDRERSSTVIKSGILNPQISSLLARVRHTNMLVIADRGFPFWPTIETVDISLVDDVPTVLQVLNAIRPNLDR
jgi:mannose-1-phosphate guanylyltransferase